MMGDIECASCCKPCTDDRVFCGQCKGWFHFVCGGVQETAYRKWDLEKKTAWKCSQACRHASMRKNCVSSESSQLQTTVLSLASATDVVSDPVALPPSTIADIRNQLEKLATCYKQLTDSVQYQSTKFDSLLSKLADQEKLISEQKKSINRQEGTISVLQSENVQLRTELSKVKCSHANLDQYSRRQNFEIHGIAERADENLEKVVLKVASALKIPCSASDLDVVHRLPVKDNKRKPIIVRLSTRKPHDAWMKKVKTGLKSCDIISDSDEQSIFINANLSPYHKHLFWKARTAAKQLKYESCWVTPSGQIYMKQTKESSRLHIKTEVDLPIEVHTPPVHRGRQTIGQGVNKRRVESQLSQLPPLLL